jgi:hypothetical protein
LTQHSRTAVDRRPGLPSLCRQSAWGERWIRGLGRVGFARPASRPSASQTTARLSLFGQIKRAFSVTALHSDQVVLRSRHHQKAPPGLSRPVTGSHARERRSGFFADV